VCGKESPSSLSYILASPSRRMLSSDATVTEEDTERGGVEVGVTALANDRALACASAWETAERYEAALAGRLDWDLDIFLNIECEGDAGLIAIGDGIAEEEGEEDAKLLIRIRSRGRYVPVDSSTPLCSSSSLG